MASTDSSSSSSETSSTTSLTTESSSSSSSLSSSSSSTPDVSSSSSTPNLSSSSSSSSPLSSSSSTSPTSTSESPSLSVGTSVVLSTTGGNVVTITKPVTVTPSRSVTSQPIATSKPKSFLQNTGAVAGTFTVVGIIVIAIVIAIITAVLRRRRARRFDREIAEAAAEAATAPVPVFLDDEDDNYGPGYGAGGYGANAGGGYSDVSSHGTYGQPAMSQESYGMSERPGPGPGGVFDHNAMYGAGAAAGAAGIGVARARSTRDGGGYAAALNEGGSPYPAFATPQHYDMYNTAPNNMGMAPVPQQQLYRGPGSADSHDGAAMAGLARGPPMHTVTQTHHTGQSANSDLSRMKSNGSRSLVDGYLSTATSATAGGSDYGAVPQGESYASHYQPGFSAATYQPQQHLNDAAGQKNVVANADEGNDAAYGGYTQDQYVVRGTPSPGLPNPFAAHDNESGDESSGEDGGRRVLKVANT